MKETAILTIVTKLTPSLSLSLTFSKDKLIEVKFIKGNVDIILPEFEPYFYGECDVKIAFKSLKFMEKHKKCMQIYKFLKEFVTFGRVITYGEIAKRFNTSPRFIGYCMKINPFPVIIPCHRVLSRNGLGGYSAGLEIKKKLLRHEGII